MKILKQNMLKTILMKLDRMMYYKVNKTYQNFRVDRIILKNVRGQNELIFEVVMRNFRHSVHSARSVGQKFCEILMIF